MLNDNAKLWVAALRSGEYKQGNGKLHNGDKLCCLGVGCVLAKKAGVLLNVTVSPSTDNVVYDGNDYFLPKSVMEWLGLATVDGFHGGTNLSAMNDREVTFAEIADIIESEPKGLFAE